MQSRTGARNITNNQVHVLQKVRLPRITWTSASWSLLQLRDGRQQLLALSPLTTEGPLELGHPIWTVTLPSLLHHLNHSWKGKMFRVQILWKAKIQNFFKGKPDSKYARISLNPGKLEVTLTVGKICLVRFYIWAMGFIYLIFWQHHTACEILVSPTRDWTRALSSEAWSSNH